MVKQTKWITVYHKYQKWQLMAWFSCYPPSPFPQNNMKKLIDRTLTILTNIFQTREKSRKMNKESQGKKLKIKSSKRDIVAKVENLIAFSGHWVELGE